MFELLLQEIMSSNLMLHPASLSSIEILIQKIRKNETPNTSDFLATLNLQSYKSHSEIVMASMGGEYPSNPFDEFEDNSIAIIPIIGPMFKYGSWWNYGMDDYANLIRLADQSSKIIGTILLCNSPGGTTQSVLQLEDALRSRSKPCVGFVDGNCMSGGMYVLSFCDEIWASNPMCMIGNIGVYTEILNDDKYLENKGLVFRAIVPPESKFKNLAYREAREGKEKMLITEMLTPYALHFQDIVKSNRPALDLSIEGIIEGKDFYAKDASTYGLIDGISNFESAIEKVKELHNLKQSIYSQFK